MAFSVDRSLILAAEAKLGRSLPPVLRNRLARDNGGDIRLDGEEWILFPVWDPTNRRTMARTANHIVGETTQARTWASFPPGAVAIAGGQDGDLIVLREGREDFELWLHDTGELVLAPSIEF